GWALSGASPAVAFCGLYVASGDERMYNQSSKVVIARDGDRTVLTMASDYQGDPKQFAVVIPVPVVPRRSQIHIGDSTWVDRLVVYSVPRLVEYNDPNPCPAVQIKTLDVRGDQKIAIRKKDSSTKQIIAGVDVMAEYKVDEYEIVILSANEARSLETWLAANEYGAPAGATKVLRSYIKQHMYFFVAKVDVTEQERLGFRYLRPIQVAYESPRFVLPLRLGMANATGPQDMLVFTLTRRGRVESTNYRTIAMPTDVDVPEFVREDFASFYRTVFSRREEAERDGAVFLEYAWMVTPYRVSRDPCTAPVMRPEELRALGAVWVGGPSEMPRPFMLTRLHVRYDAKRFPEDLQLQETANRTNWQARYVIHHPYRGPEECSEMTAYRKKVWERREEEARNYCELTGASLQTTRAKMAVGEKWEEPAEAMQWWERIWAR
ncbi:MAG TPA: DUF2330 domain-containing protein, partial [Candidatus Eisenbacteria bacterium]|nr:DUF2330 domain-containing protein [Candidatus Eisenbacteria bacterium]